MASLREEQLKEAARLYLSGLSMQQVATHLEVSIDAVVYALRKQQVQRRTTQQTNAIRFEAKELSYSIKKNLSEREERLKLAAIMLYWAEGYKVGKNCVDFANSDVDTAIIFKKFLTEICQVNESRIRCYLYCYEGQDIPTIRKFWSEELGIPESQFTKPYVKRANPGPRGPRMYNGLVHIRYCDTKLLRQILIWIDEYRAECVGGGAVNREWL